MAQPSPDSLAFRANLARLVSPLRRVRARVPFYQLAAHRIPTLWSLYRGLLKEAPTEDIKFRVRMAFRQNHHLTGTEATKKHLLRGYKYLNAFRNAKRGDEKLRAVIQRYSQLIATKREKEYWKQLARDEMAWQARLRSRPILTGGYLRPTMFNKPLPRMKPQPPAITRIIAKRRAARERRLERLNQLQDTLDDLRRERDFEDGLAQLVGTRHRFTRLYSGPEFDEWVLPIREARESIFRAFQRAKARSNMPYTPAMLESIKQARREKIANKTRELERERGGEILRRTIKRRNQGPPAHVLQKMNPEERKMDKVVRSVSEVGYVGQVKRKLGFKLRDPEAWKKEIGSLEDKERLDRMMEQVRAENERRRRAVEWREKGHENGHGNGHGNGPMEGWH